MKEFVKELVFSPQQLLNGQRVQRISGLQKFDVRFGSWNVGGFCGRGMEVCKQLRKRKVDMCCQQKVHGEGKKFEFLVAEVGDISCGGLKIMME